MTNNPAVSAPEENPVEVALAAEEPVRITMDKRAEFVVLLVMVALGATIIYFASGFRLGAYPDPVTTRGLSYATGGYMIVAGLYLAIRRLLTWSAIPGWYTLSEGNDDERGHPASSLRAFSIIGLAVFWAVSVRSVGFLIVTPFVMIAMLWLMNVRVFWKLFIFPVIFTIATWFIFAQMLGIRLPYGIMTDLARSWGLIY